MALKRKSMRVKNAIELGKSIQKKRKSMGYTQLDISERTGLSASFISDVENGKETAEIGKVILVLNILGLNLLVEDR